MRYFCFVALSAVAAIFSAPLQAEVVPDTQIQEINSAIGVNFFLDVFQTPDPPGSPNSNLTGVSGSIEVMGATVTLDFTDFGLDEGSDWYVVSANDIFTAQTIANGDFPSLVVTSTGSLDALTVPVGESFFLGVNTGTGFDSDGDGNRQHFGWVELSVNDSGPTPESGFITVLDSAVAYDQGGIIVGTNQSVPEPSSAAVLFLVAAASSCCRRRV